MTETGKLTDSSFGDLLNPACVTGMHDVEEQRTSLNHLL